MNKTYGSMHLASVNGARMWQIKCEAHVQTRFKRVFERVAKSSSTGVIDISDTPENCRDLEWFMERYPLFVPEMEYLERRAREYDEQLDLIRRILGGQQPPRQITLAKPAYQGQLVGAELAMARGRILVADELGAGKTITALCMIANPECRPAVVVTLTDLPRQWLERIQEFTPDLKAYVLKTGRPFGNRPRHGYGPLDLAHRIDRGAPVPDVIITNYAKLPGWVEYFIELGVKSVTFDEIQELRTGAGTTRYNAAQQLTSRVSYAMGLSATPIYNYGGEVYNVVNCLIPDAFGSHEEFVREWTTTVGNGKQGIKDPEALGRHLREQGYMIRRTVAEITGKAIDKPQSIIHKIEADTHVLDKMATDAAELAKIIIAQSGHTNIEKFQAAGQFDYRLRQATGIAKAPYVAAFAKILLQSEERLAIFAWHHEVYSLLASALWDFKPVLINGKETIPARQRAKAEFCGGDSRVILISLRAGAGMDGLQKFSRVAMFAELDWSPRIHDQCVGRLARPGQERQVLAYYPICDYGSDPVMCDALGIKNQLSHGILEPDAPLVEQMESTGANIKQLAAAYLAQMGIETPAESTSEDVA